MRYMFLKVLLFIAGFLVTQILLMPMLITHNDFPLWAIIIFFSGILVGWIALVERVILIFRREDECAE